MLIISPPPQNVKLLNLPLNLDSINNSKHEFWCKIVDWFNSMIPLHNEEVMPFYGLSCSLVLLLCCNAQQKHLLGKKEANKNLWNKQSREIRRVQRKYILHEEKQSRSRIREKSDLPFSWNLLTDRSPWNNATTKL